MTDDRFPDSITLLKLLLTQPAQFRRTIHRAGITNPTQRCGDLLAEGGIKKRYLYRMLGTLVLYLIIVCIAAPFIGLILNLFSESTADIPDILFNTSFGVWAAALVMLICGVGWGLRLSAPFIVVFGIYLAIFWGLGFYLVFTYPHPLVIQITIPAGPVLSAITGIMIEGKIRKA